MKKETILTVVVCVLVVVSAIGIPAAYVLGQGDEEIEPDVRPAYLMWECTNGTWNETRLQLVHSTVYPDSYEVTVKLLNNQTGEVEEYAVYCELNWSKQYVVLASNKGDYPPVEPTEPTYLEPITENATTTITVSHSGNAIVMPTHNSPRDRDQYLRFENGIQITKDDMLTNFEKTYLGVVMYKEYPTTLYNANDKTYMTWVTVTYSIVFFASDGSLTIVHQDQNVIIDMTTNDSDIHATIDSHDNAQTTISFHYPKIVGWK